MSWIAEVREWTDGIDGEWKRPLADLVSHPASRVIAVEAHKTDPRILDVFAAGSEGIVDQGRRGDSLRHAHDQEP